MISPERRWRSSAHMQFEPNLSIPYRAACFHVVTREGLILNVAAESVEMASTWVHDLLLFNRGLRNNILNLSQVRGLNHVAAAAKPASQSSGGGGGGGGGVR